MHFLKSPWCLSDSSPRRQRGESTEKNCLWKLHAHIAQFIRHNVETGCFSHVKKNEKNVIQMIFLIWSKIGDKQMAERRTIYG